MRSIVTAASALLLTTVVGCGGSYQLPADRLGEADGAVRSADELGAKSNPDAAFALQRANQEIDAAKAAAAKGDEDHANGYLARAQADAELALAVAKSAKARAEADDAVNRAKALQTGK